MLIHEFVRLQKSVDSKRERQGQRLSARRLRAQLREQRRAERLLTEIRSAHLC